MVDLSGSGEYEIGEVGGSDVWYLVPHQVSVDVAHTVYVVTHSRDQARQEHQVLPVHIRPLAITWQTDYVTVAPFVTLYRTITIIWSVTAVLD